MNKPRFFMKRPLVAFLMIASLVLILVLVLISARIVNSKPTTNVHIGTQNYSLWLANTKPELIQGLSGVEKLKPDGGLLMDFGFDGLHGIWMKDMNFPLDIVWLDRDKKVVYIVNDAPVEDPVQTVYAPKDPAWYVLELPVGSVEKAGIKTGITANFSRDV